MKTKGFVKRGSRFHETGMHRMARRTGTRPPPILSSTPCPYRMGPKVMRDYPIRLSEFIKDAGGCIATKDAHKGPHPAPHLPRPYKRARSAPLLLGFLS